MHLLTFKRNGNKNEMKYKAKLLFEMRAALTYIRVGRYVPMCRWMDVIVSNLETKPVMKGERERERVNIINTST